MMKKGKKGAMKKSKKEILSCGFKIESRYFNSMFHSSTMSFLTVLIKIIY
jgi:hypothetical protein